jgi:hypothetical protein
MIAPRFNHMPHCIDLPRGDYDCSQVCFISAGSEGREAVDAVSQEEGQKRNGTAASASSREQKSEGSCAKAPKSCKASEVGASAILDTSGKEVDKMHHEVATAPETVLQAGGNSAVQPENALGRQHSDSSAVTAAVEDTLADLAASIEVDKPTNPATAGRSPTKVPSFTDSAAGYAISVSDNSGANGGTDGDNKDRTLAAAPASQRLVRPSLAVSMYRGRPRLAPTASDASSIHIKPMDSGVVAAEPIFNPYAVGPDPMMAWKAEVLRTLRNAEDHAMTIASLAALATNPVPGTSYSSHLQEHLVDRKLAIWVVENESIQLT